MFSIFKKNKRNRAEILLLSELVATTRSELRAYQREVYELQQQINDALRDYCEDFVQESTYEENRDQTDERLDVLEANVMFKEQAIHELAKLSAMLFLLVTKEGYDFEEFEKESQPIYEIFVKDAE